MPCLCCYLDIDSVANTSANCPQLLIDEYGLMEEEEDVVDNATQIYIQTINSLRLDSSDLLKRNFPAFRFLSIDGGHTHTVTLNDLMFSCDLVMGGTVIVLDDLPRPDWIGVASGLFTFLNGQSLLQPFLFSRNKVYLTTGSHRDQYIASLETTGMNCRPKRNAELAQFLVSTHSTMCLSLILV